MQEQEVASTETPGAQTLRRGLSILKLLARYQPAGLRISDIGRRLGLTKATAVRLTQALVDERFVIHDAATRCYRLGPETFAVGLAAEPGYALQRLATASLRALALETGDWVFFSVVQGFEAICSSREPGGMPSPPDALGLGDRPPRGVGAGGLAILASLPDDEVETALRVNGRYIDEHFPKSSVAVIRQLVGETRDTGDQILVSCTGVTDGELLHGVRFFGGGYRTQTLFMSLSRQIIRFVDTIHREQLSTPVYFE